MATVSGIADLIFELKHKCCQTEDTIRAAASLTQAEYKVIEVLYPDEEVRSVELAGRMDLSPSRCSRIVEGMTKHNYLQASPSTEDRRSLALKLTPAGAKIHRKIKTLKAECDAKIASRIPDGKRDQILSALNTLVEIL